MGAWPTPIGGSFPIWVPAPWRSEARPQLLSLNRSMLPPRPAHGPCHLVLRCLGWCSGDPIPASWDQSFPPPPAPEGPARRDGRRLWLYFPGLACCGPGLGPPTGPVPHLPEETLGGWSWQPLGSYGSSPVPVLVSSRGRMDAGTRRVPPRPQSRWREQGGPEASQGPPSISLGHQRKDRAPGDSGRRHGRAGSAQTGGY